MPVPMNGEPVRISLATSTAGTSTVSLGLYVPQTSTLRVLGPSEALVVTSLLFMTGDGNGFNIWVTTLPSGTISTSINQANTLLVCDPTTNQSVVWVDDGTGAITGLPGIVPSVLHLVLNGSTYVTGSGLIVNTAPQPGRNPQWANLTQNPNGNL